MGTGYRVGALATRRQRRTGGRSPGCTIRSLATRRIQISPFVTVHVSLRGFVFDVATGRLDEVTP
jgi:hypothetical protein